MRVAIFNRAALPAFVRIENFTGCPAASWRIEPLLLKPAAINAAFAASTSSCGAESERLYQALFAGEIKEYAGVACPSYAMRARSARWIARDTATRKAWL